MKAFNAIIGGLLALVVLGCGKQAAENQPTKSNPAAEAAATTSAQSWLALVDGGSFGQSWETAAAVFKSAVSQADWEKTVRAVRTPLGKMVTRKIKSSRYATSLPGAPDGEYVVIQYETVFENKAAAIETITPMREPEGKWRVSGYFIK